MKTIRYLAFAALLFFSKSLFAQYDNMYAFRAVHPGGGSFDNYYFGDQTSGTTAFFIHASGGPVLAQLGLGIVYSGGQIKFDLSLISTAGLSGDYNDLLNKPAIPVIQRARAQTDASGNYTWTYPNAYAGGVIPIIQAIPEGGSTVPLNVQIVGTPTNTSVTFKVMSLPSTSVLGIVVLGAPTGTQAYLHLTATLP